MRIKVLVIAAASLLTAAAVSLHAIGSEQDDDRAAVERTVLDYVEGLYGVNPELIEQSVSRELVKVGFWHNEESDEWTEIPMTFEELKGLAGSWNQSGWIPEDAPKKVVVFDVRDRTASASLEAIWGMDHMQLVKTDGQWKIVHVLWHSTPGSRLH